MWEGVSGSFEFEHQYRNEKKLKEVMDSFSEGSTVGIKSHYASLTAPQWGAADAEIQVPSGENTGLKRSPF